jgi:hypothetical protein
VCVCDSVFVGSFTLFFCSPLSFSLSLSLSLALALCRLLWESVSLCWCSCAASLGAANEGKWRERVGLFGKVFGLNGFFLVGGFVFVCFREHVLQPFVCCLCFVGLGCFGR